VLKDADAVTAIVQSRIAYHKAAEAKKEEETRQRIRAEEQKKAQEEAEAKTKREADEAAAKIKADEATQKAAAQQEQPVKPPIESLTTSTPQGDPRGSVVRGAPAVAAAPPLITKPSIKLAVAGNRPCDDDIIDALADRYRVHESKVLEWLRDMDLQAAEQRMAKQFAA
jgi:hypothetical protein